MDTTIKTSASSVGATTLSDWKSPVWQDVAAPENFDLLSSLPFADDMMGEVVTYGCYDPFPFLRLPGELRNKIYEYVYSFCAIMIQNIPADEYSPGSPRTKYRVRVERTTRTGPKTYLQETTYEVITIEKSSEGPEGLPHIKPLSRSLFFTNRQVQKEVAPFIYCKTYAFNNVQAIVPYLQDQPRWAHAMIKDVMLWPRDDHRCTMPTKSWSMPWRMACDYIRRNLKLHRLGVILCRYRAINIDSLSIPEIWENFFLELCREKEEWMEPLATITGLKRVGVKIERDKAWGDDPDIDNLERFFQLTLSLSMVET